MGVFLASFLTALCVSALCSIAESVLLSLSTAQIAEIKEKNRRVGEIWEAFKKNVEAPITSILAVNTAAHTIGASLAGAAFAQEFGDSKLWIFSVIFTFLMLQYTEILPKTLGVRYNKRFAFWVARPLWFATKFGAPIIKFIRLCNKPFEPRGSNGDKLSSIQELRYLTTAAEEAEQLDEEQAEVILEALDLNVTFVRQIMRPIEKARFIEAEATLEEATLKAIEDGHTRFPVIDKAGNVEKYVNVKELARGVVEKQHNGGTEPEIVNVEDIARELLVISPDDVASEMLTRFVDESQHIALVRDEKTGENVGILTLEDLVEELLGEIKDEFDGHNRVDDVAEGLACGAGCEIGDVIDEIKARYPEDCAEAVEILRKFDEETRANVAGGDEKSAEKTLLKTWFRAQLPKSQKKISDEASVALGRLRVDAHKVQGGKLKEAMIRLRRDGE
jgi:CBS domain containing-hemolysin-like protein